LLIVVIVGYALLFSPTDLLPMETSVEIRRSKLLLKLFAFVIFYMSLCVDRNVVYGT